MIDAGAIFGLVVVGALLLLAAGLAVKWWL